MARLKVYNEAIGQWEYVAYGIKGDQGDPGSPGAPGATGADGADGDSAYQV